MEVLGDRDIKIPKDFVLIKINSKKWLTKKVKGEDGKELNFDLSSIYTRMDEEFIPDDDSLIAYDGIIQAIPVALTKKSEIDIDVKVGDHVTLDFLGVKKEYSPEFYENVINKIAKAYTTYVTTNLYCKVVDGEIVMLGDWNLIEIEKVKEKEYSSNIIVPVSSLVKKENIGFMKCVSPKSSLVKGDRVYVDSETVYTIYIEGKSYYIVSDRDILAQIL